MAPAALQLSLPAQRLHRKDSPLSLNGSSLSCWPWMMEHLQGMWDPEALRSIKNFRRDPHGRPPWRPQGLGDRLGGGTAQGSACGFRPWLPFPSLESQASRRAPCSPAHTLCHLFDWRVAGHPHHPHKEQEDVGSRGAMLCT